MAEYRREQEVGVHGFPQARRSSSWTGLADGALTPFAFVIVVLWGALVGGG